MSIQKSTLKCTLTLALLAGACLGLSMPAQAKDTVDAKQFQTMKYRGIGPYRGGRVTAVAGIEEDTHTYYMGATGGGVWKTDDAGVTWDNISDGFFNTASIGAIDVADSDPNIIYVGTGEGPVRGVKTTHGDGVYKSTDAGKTWTHMGLKATRHISRLHVHPTNPDIVWVAAQGNPWGPNEERGVYKTTDGGKTWAKVLYMNENSGIGDLTIDAKNPDFLMATSWDFNRKPWVVHSGGPGSQVHKSTDGGKTWKQINAGLPKLKGKMGIAISPANPKIVYIAMEANPKEGGIYRSDNGGESFRQISDEPNAFARAWYYTHITADPNDEDEIWTLNGVLIKSIDAGKTWKSIKINHPDHHAMWINPSNSDIIINGNDGGANVTLNGGRTWSTQFNQPTAQLYRIIADNKYPYRIYSAQQDNVGIVISSQGTSRGIGFKHWGMIGSGESATIGFDPENPKYVYSTHFGGAVTEWDQDVKLGRSIRPYPEQVPGEMPKNLKYRANWNGPIIVSPHNPEQIYYGSQYLMSSTDRGVSWKVLSEDLTRNDKDHQGKGGEPITNEQITAESYNNLFVIAESPLEKGVIWTGSDDGLIHITRDGGKTFTNVTPKGLKEGIINVIDASPHDAGTMYFAFAGYKLNDFTPSIYKTTNYGKSWKKIVKGLPKDTFARSVRVDPKRNGLLYAGTETGVFVSFDDGANWQSLQLNLPEVPITDLFIRQDDLLVATQGRSIWILDDLTTLHQMSDAVKGADYTLLKPRNPVRNGSVGFTLELDRGKNPPRGLQVHYVLNKEVPKDTAIRFDIINVQGNVVYSDSTDMTGTICGRGQAAMPRPKTISNKSGDNLWSWKMNMGLFECLPEIYNVSGSMEAYSAAPGAYKVRMTIGNIVQEQNFRIRVDPRLGGDTAANLRDYAEIDDLSAQLFRGASEMGKGVKDLRLVKKQLAMIVELDKNAGVVAKAKVLDKTIDVWIAKILQKELKTYQHVYQYEGKLLMKFKNLLGDMHGADVPLTDGFRDVSRDYVGIWNSFKAELEALKLKDIAAFNVAAKAAGVAEISLP